MGPLWGAIAAVVATFFTFLSSSLFILAGGPLVEATHGELRFTATLTGITAAVVGVISNLAVFFACRVLWPEGKSPPAFAGGFDWLAALIGTVAFAALARFKVGVIPVLGAARWPAWRRIWYRDSRPVSLRLGFDLDRAQLPQPRLGARQLIEIAVARLQAEL
jgi:hypothetical protein